MRITEPMRRRGGSIRWALLLLVVLCAGLGTLVVRWSRPGAATTSIQNYHAQLADLARHVQPDGENGWGEFADAIEETRSIIRFDIDGLDEDSKLLTTIRGFERIRSGPYEPELLASERLLLQRIRDSGALERVDAALAKPRLLREDYGDPEELIQSFLLPELSAMRDLVKAVTAMMRIALHEGDRSTYVAAFDRSLLMAQAISRQPIAVSHLAAMAPVLWPWTNFAGPSARSALMKQRLLRRWSASRGTQFSPI